MSDSGNVFSLLCRPLLGAMFVRESGGTFTAAVYLTSGGELAGVIPGVRRQPVIMGPAVREELSEVLS